MENRKIRGATSLVTDGIRFKSKLEANVYKELVKAGFHPEYEKVTFVLWEGFRPSVPFYTKRGRANVLNMKKTIDITYTPDFTFTHDNTHVIIEVKGFQNDVFPVKFKMFRKMLENEPYRGNTLLFEVFSLRQLRECIDIIRSYGKEYQGDSVECR